MIYDAQQEAQRPKDSVLQEKENHRYQGDAMMVSSPDEHLSQGGQKAIEKLYRTNVVVDMPMIQNINKGKSARAPWK